MSILKRAQKYLTNEYGGDFSVVDIKCIWEGSGLLPVLISNIRPIPR